LEQHGAPRPDDFGKAWIDRCFGHDAMRLIRDWGEFVKFSHTIFACPCVIIDGGRRSATTAVAWAAGLCLVCWQWFVRDVPMAFTNVDRKIEALNRARRPAFTRAGVSVASA